MSEEAEEKPSRADYTSPDYTLDEVVLELAGEGEVKGRMDPVLVGLSAEFHLDRIPETFETFWRSAEVPFSFDDTVRRLKAWLENETRHIPESLAKAMLYWLTRVRDHLKDKAPS